jgi:hypothetical protein
MTVIKSQNPTLIALSGDAYELLLTQLNELERSANDKDTEIRQMQIQNLKNSLKHVAVQSALSTVSNHLSKFLDEFEGAFDCDEKCTSPEIAMDYINAATYMKKNLNRDDRGVIERVQTWYDNYLPC